MPRSSKPDNGHLPSDGEAAQRLLQKLEPVGKDLGEMRSKARDLRVYVEKTIPLSTDASPSESA